MPYQQQYGQPGFPPQPPKKSNKGLIIALSVLGVLAAVVLASVVIVGFVVGDDRVSATDLEVGSCITAVPKADRVATLPMVDCAQPHGGEVYALLAMPDGDYPGAETIDEWQSKCPDKLAEYSPQAVRDGVGVYVLYPTQETWDEGDRAVTCVATLEPKRTGTLKE
jgi:hypothetical protein